MAWELTARLFFFCWTFPSSQLRWQFPTLMQSKGRLRAGLEIAGILQRSFAPASVLGKTSVGEKSFILQWVICTPRAGRSGLGFEAS